ncbi:MAG: hypothetical protein GY791_08565 [Alphaproteobacteria bacterium]|nr:hypothetical protein [Alphaproteobacteria bacterium]
MFTISARSKPPEQPVLRFLAKNYATVPIAQIDSLFGFVEGSTLYGGRVFNQPELYERDVAVMYDVGIGVRIPLTNHFAEEPEYEENLAFLDKYHRPGNAAIVTNDKLAEWIRRDFPKYRIEASVIKNIDTQAKIDAALEIYDTVVLPMELCEQPEFLEKLENKQRITLFANAGCALTCPARICYVSVSKINKGRNDTQWRCSQPIKDRDTRGMVDFDLEHLSDLGFRRFKLLRSRPGGKTGV